MIIFILSLQVTLFLTKANGDGEFSILHHPSSISFKGHDDLKESTISEIYSAAFGFSNFQFSDWNGILINDPFHLAECIATIYLEGVPSLDQAEGHNFPLKIDTDDTNIFSTVRDRIISRYPEENPQIVHINLGNGLEDISQNDLFKEIKNNLPLKNNILYLKNNAEDREFLKEVNLLNLIAEKITNGIEIDGIPDFYWFKVSSLHPLIDYYGDNSTEVKEAKHLLNEAIHRICSAYKKVYKGAVFFSVITSDASHTRRTRSILASKEDRNLNLASEYSENFPVIFNIILWLSIILGFSLLAISLVIGNMDPGRDSIIYRMTNPRMKKDN